MPSSICVWLYDVLGGTLDFVINFIFCIKVWFVIKFHVNPCLLTPQIWYGLYKDSYVPKV